MQTFIKAALGITLAVTGAVVLFVSGEPMTGPAADAPAMGAAISTGAGLGELGGYLILMLIIAVLGTVVAWMLFGKRE